MKRRTALQVVTAAIGPGQFAIAQHHLITLAQATESYKPRFFNPEQIELLSQLSEMIIPADDQSPGAREAQVSLFIDLIVSHSAPDIQERWKSGVKLVETEAQNRSGKPFLKCAAAEQDRILGTIAAGEADPKTELERFFALLKLMTIDGYYTSAIGIHRELRYKGNAVLSRFPGCSHSDH